MNPCVKGRSVVECFKVVDCGNPPSVINGEITSSGTTFQQQAFYSCVPGYVLSTDTPTVIRVCQANMAWSGEIPECTRISCGDFLPPENNIVNFIDGNTLFESRAQYVCNPGYKLQGNTERVCQANELWSSTAPTCNPISCGPLTNPENGTVQVSSIFFPGMATYSCNTNFELVNGPQTRTCQTDATWSENEPSCQVIVCPQLNNPANGQVSIDVSSTGNTTATYTCDEGYELIGNDFRRCQLNSEWSGTEPTCQNIDLVEVSFLQDLYIVLEGGLLEVCMSVNNFGDGNIRVSGQLIIPDLNLTSSFSIESLFNTSMKHTQVLSFPDDDIINERAQNRFTLMLVLTSPNIITDAAPLKSFINPEQRGQDIFSVPTDTDNALMDGSAPHQIADVIVVDDEIVEVRFEALQYTFYEDQGPAHICVQVIQGSGNQRPMVGRVHILECAEKQHNAKEGEDFEALWEIVSVNINSDEGDLFCFYVNLVDDEERESSEVFKVILEIFDVNTFVPSDGSMAFVTILDNEPSLVIQFNDNTPEVTGSEVRVSFTSNRPLSSVTCHITNRQRASNCIVTGNSGSFTFTGISGISQRNITITATTSVGEVAVLHREVRSEATGQCSVHLTNEGVIINTDNNTVDFQISIIGPSPDNRVTEASCSLDGGPTEPCPDPLQFPTGSPGPHTLTVIPIDTPEDICSCVQASTINYVL